MRKIFIILTVLTIGVMAMAYLYFSNLNKENSANENSLNLISAASGIVFTFDNERSFYDILNSQTILDEILGEQKSKDLKSLRKHLIANSGIDKLIKSEKIYVGFVTGEKNSIDYVIATQTKITDVNFEKLLNNGSFKMEAKEGYHQITFPDSTICFVGIQHKTILLANSLTAFQKIAVLNEQQSEFANYIKENSRFNKNTLANVYLDYSKIPMLLKSILNTNLTGELSVFNKQKTYAALSYNFGSDKLLLNGYTEIRDPKNYYTLFANQPEQIVTIDQLLPDKTANYTLFTMNDYDSWRKHLATWHRENKKTDQIAKQFKVLDEKYRIDIAQNFPEYFQKQFAVFQLNSGEKLGIVKMKNGDKLAQLLLDLSTEYTPEIRIFNEPGLLYNFFGEPFVKFERPFYIVIDNHLVVANYLSSLQSFLNSYRNNQLLTNTTEYANFKDQVSNTATICFYVNNKNSTNIFGRNLKRPYYNQAISKKGFKDYNAFAYQLSADNGKFLSNLLLLKTQKRIEADSLIN